MEGDPGGGVLLHYWHFGWFCAALPTHPRQLDGDLRIAPNALQILARIVRAALSTRVVMKTFRDKFLGCGAA